MSLAFITAITNAVRVTGINTYRIYNPVKQSKEHDENGDFIKKWVPELQNLNSNWVHEPWKMDFETQKNSNVLLERLSTSYSRS